VAGLERACVAATAHLHERREGRLRAAVAMSGQVADTACNRAMKRGQTIMHRSAMPAIVLASALAGSMIFATGAPAQEGPGGLLNPQRDCQTIRTCNFRRGGSYRGCLSSYSCRECRFVRASCRGLGRRGVCRRLVCTWGGVS
jgi:hypothetical protein